MDIQAAKKRCEAATEGPWEFANGFYGWDMGIFPVGCKDRLNEAVVANNGHSNGDLNQANGDFIAHARSDLPAALEALEEAHRRGDGYKGESETSFARARRAEKALAEVQGKLGAVAGVRDALKNLRPKEGTVVYETLRRLDRILGESE